MDTLSRERLVDKLVEAYVDWRQACIRVDETYCSSASQTGRRGRVAFGLYMAALDAEEQAAGVYELVVQRASELTWGDEPAPGSRGPGRRVARS